MSAEEPTLLERFHSYIVQNPGCTPLNLFVALDRRYHTAGNYMVLKRLEAAGLIRKERLTRDPWGRMLLYSTVPQMEDMPEILNYDN